MNGNAFDPSLATVSCSVEESMGNEMLDIQPLDLVGEQRGSYSVTSN